MNNEYVRELLHQETIDTFGYPPDSGIRANWYSGNDYYNNILVNRENQVSKIDTIISKLNSYKTKVTDENLIASIEKHVNTLNVRKAKIEKFGYEAIIYTYGDDPLKSNYPYLEGKKSELALRFKYTYGNMRIAYNTAEQFNEHLQAIFDNIAPEYENRLRLQELYEKQILNETRKLQNLDVSDKSNTENNVSTYHFNEQSGSAARKTLENVSKVSTQSSTLQSQIKNIMSGYMINQTVLKEYLDEFGVLFIRVWGDRTRW